MSPAQHVVFVGLMGSGKTTVGQLVADALGLSLRDCDVDISQLTGMTASDYAEVHGIDALHEEEAAALLGALRETASSVITAAASTIEVAACRGALEPAFVVWLRSDAAVLAGRAVTSNHRPLADDALAQLRAQGDRRDALFAATADLVLDARRSPAELAAEVIEQTARHPEIWVRPTLG